MSHPSAFKTPEGEAAFLAAYDAAMKCGLFRMKRWTFQVGLG